MTTDSAVFRGKLKGKSAAVTFIRRGRVWGASIQYGNKSIDVHPLVMRHYKPCMTHASYLVAAFDDGTLVRKVARESIDHVRHRPIKPTKQPRLFKLKVRH